MALDIRIVNLLLEKINQSDRATFGSIASQLFQHLGDEIKDNQIFDDYNSHYSEWVEWINKLQGNVWFIPITLEKAKQMAFSLYKFVAEQGVKGYNIPGALSSKANYVESINEFNSRLLDYFELAIKDVINANPELILDETKPVIGDAVFIIHGHDDFLRTELQLVLERAKVHNIVLHEVPDKGRTIIDKLTEEGVKSSYAIALMSPDDIMEDGTQRARQNVVLEIGYFIGLIGKERVRILKKGDIEIPSDLQGILYEKFDNSNTWKIKILKELRAVGIHVDIDNVIQTI